LAGVARELTRQLDVPVVCTLSGEDIFLEKLPQPYRDQAREILIERCADLAALVAMNGYYADVMAEYLCVNREKIDVIRPGLNLDGIEPTRSPQPESDTRVIGYLARVCHEKGLHQLVEALTLLVDDPALPAVRLLAAGYLGDADRPYLDTVARQLAERGMSERFEYVGELDRTEKIAFLQSLDVMSVPTVYRESKGLSILEAWANGVPTVLPAHGTFPELTEQTGGGLLCEPGNPTSLAESLKRILVDPALATKHTTAAQATVHREFNAQRMAQETLQLYDRVCGHRQVRRVRPDAP
ncbi:MAG TPA: glycosyltransferase family 4 protein, partial [Thermoguttaceae bacterium]|nr:glycosyltransferase family 4 protein [Thermoguttaceae bacterium]